MAPINKRMFHCLALLVIASLFAETSYAQLALQWYHQTPPNEHHVFREIALTQAENGFYISDLELDRLLQFDNRVLPLPIAVRGDPSWQSGIGPYGIDLSADGWLYVAVWEDQIEHALWRLRQDGSQISRLCDLPEPPRGIHVTGEGTDTIVYVSGNYGSVIQCQQNSQGQFAAEILFVTGITMNQQDVLHSIMSDAIYVSSWSDHYGWTPYTSPVTKWDVHGNRDENFSVSYLPQGNVPAMVFDPVDSMLYLLHISFAGTDRNARIYKVDPVSGNSITSIIVGPGGTSGGGGIDVSYQGEVYFAMALGTIDGFRISAFGKVGAAISNKVIQVPSDFATIQAAIDAAIPSDTVLVAPGLYAERLTIAKEIALISEAGEAVTIINSTGLGQNRQSWVADVSANCLISGFTLTSDDPYTFGILCHFCSPILENNIITGLSYSGIGSFQSSPLVRRNLITGCQQVGIIMNTEATPQIINNTIVVNRTGIVASINSRPVVTNNIIANNWISGLQANPDATMANSYNDLWGQPSNYSGNVRPGEGEISADPRFVGGSPFDYHLQASSPCINAGDPNSPLDPDDTRADLGAFPFEVAREIVFGETPQAHYSNVTFDSHIREISYAQERNYGAVDNLRIMGANPLKYEWKGLIKFDFRAGLLAEGVTHASGITRATLRLHLSESEGSKTDMLRLFRLLRDWGEGSHDNENADIGEVTWRHAKHEVAGWQSYGAEGLADRALPPDAEVLLGNTPGVWYQFDVTHSVRQMFDENRNFGWLLELEEGAGMRYFNSKECVAPELRPVLALAIVPPDPMVSTEITFGEFATADFSGVTHDSHIREIEFAQHRNYGVVDNLRLLGDNPEKKEWKGLLKFDFLPGLNSLGVLDPDRIMSAKIRLHLSETEGAKSDKLYFYRLRKDWGEGTHNNVTAATGEVTWISAKENELLWTEAGARDGGDDRVAISDLVQVIGNVPDSWYEFDVTASVRTMLDTHENHGWLLELEPNAGMRYFSSKEAANEQLRPKLIISVNGLLSASKSNAVVLASEIPAHFVLEQNHPNPFNPETEIRFQIPQESHIVLAIYSVLGQEIRRLADALYAAGHHTIRWDGNDASGAPVASGVYLYRLQAGGFTQVKKMSLVR